MAIIYRLIWRDAEGVGFFRSAHIECGTDREALEIAEHQIGDDEITIDLWDGLRPVGRVGSSDL
jgi:hypothetical protein